LNRPTAFFSKTYDEAMDLLVEARNYVAGREADDRLRLDVETRLRLCTATMRLTSRLTQIMSWLLAQRAVHAGEMAARDVVERWEPLAAVGICMEEDGDRADGLPPALVSLLDRSRRLYIRVARLDEMLRRSERDSAPLTSA
jgi:regulator of CtrA degradation